MKRTAIIAALLVNGFFSLAQKDTVDLLPVEVRSLRAPEKAPFAKTNITKDELRKQNLGQDLPFLLQQTPSVVVNSDAGNGIGYTGIRIRGTDATRINVTLNGIPYNDAESGGTFFVDLPDFASSVSNIQIQRGVGASSNGAGAFGASININTNEVVKQRSLEVNNSYGSFNSWKNTLLFNSGLVGKYFTVDGRLSRIKSDGYIDRATSDLKGYYLSAAYLKNKTTLRFTTFSGKEKTYQAWYGVAENDLVNNRTKNTAGTARPGGPYDNETDNYTQNHYQAFFNQQLSPYLVFNTGIFLVTGKGYYEQYRANQKYSSYGMPNAVNGSTTITRTDLIRQLWLDNDFYGDVFSLNYKRGASDITIGGAVTNYLGKHFGEVIWAKEGITGNKRWYDNDAAKKDFNVYTKWQQQLNTPLQIFTDLQYRYVRHEIEGFRNHPTLAADNRYHFFNPKIGLSYNANNWSSYASYSIAHKEPNRADFETGAEKQPKAERLNDVELGMERKNSAYQFGANLYYMTYKDQLVLTGKVNDVGAYTRTNIKDSYRAGVEMQAAYKLAQWIKVSGNIAFSRNKIRDFDEYIDNYDNGQQQVNKYRESDISFSPNVVGAGTLSIVPEKHIQLELIGKYVGKQFLDNTSNKDRMLDAFYTQDVRAIFSTSRKALKNVQFTAQVFNVFNALYEPNGYTFSYIAGNKLTTENYYYPMAGTNWLVGLNIRL